MPALEEINKSLVILDGFKRRRIAKKKHLRMRTNKKVKVTHKSKWQGRSNIEYSVISNDTFGQEVSILKSASVDVYQSYPKENHYY